MNKNQWIAVLVAIAATVGIYLGTTNVKPKKAQEAHHEGDGHDHGPANAGPMMGSAMPAPANFDSVLAATKKKLLSPQSAAEINGLETQAVTGTDAAAQATAYQTLSKRWQKMNQFGIAAHYMAKAGSLEKSEKLLNFAAHLYSEGMAEEQDPRLRQWMAESRFEILNKIVDINPKNDSAQVDVAIAQIDKGDVMNGVLKLREFADKNPQNIRAQIVLGKMAVQSNQLEKAIERGNKVLAIDKENIEARLFMGEAYKEMGNVDRATDLFLEAKKLMNNPDFSKDIDAYIATFKKKEP